MDLEKEWENFCNDSLNNNNIIDNNYKNDTFIEKEKFTPKCSDLYISTQTKIAYLSREFDLKNIFWKLKILPYHKFSEGLLKKSIKINSNSKVEVEELEKHLKTEKLNDKSVRYNIINHFDDPSSRKIKFKDVRKIIVGVCSKDLISSRKKEKGAFYNCFALIIRLKYNGVFKEVHIKVFNTGKLEIPGIQSDDLLIKSIEYLISILQVFYEEKINYSMDKIQTVLINSNFNCGFYLDRNKLYNILKYNYDLDVIYDPCSYPGIQCKFYYNLLRLDDKNGICRCEKKCCKKKNSKKKNKCIEISFMIFRTGSVLIVGNCSKNILEIVYAFLKNILLNEFENIYIENDSVKKTKKKKKRKKSILIKIK